LLHRVARTAGRYAMFSPGQTAGVAVSGGADSVCLLFALRELAPQWGIALRVLHLDHGLRGEESRGDADFVRELAERLHLPVTVERADLRGLPGEAAGNLEETARQARLEFFRRRMAEGAVDRVALGHTCSDQAETVLFRFLRGAATAGLAGIRPITSDGIVRPLLEVDRRQVEEFLKRRGIRWREDSSNRSPEFARNRIRHGLLPQLAREWNPAIGETLAHTADWALAEEAWWETEIDAVAAKLLEERDGALLVRVQDLAGLPLAVARRLTRRAVERVKGDLRGIDFGHVADVLAMATDNKGHGRVAAPGLEVARSFDWLRFSPEGGPGTEAPTPYSVPAPVPGVVEVPGAGIAISLELLDKPETSEGSEYVYNGDMGCVDWPRVSGPLELRSWRPGDRYQPIGHTGEEKIKRLFQKARIPFWERGGWPVLTDGCGIVWARRFGPAARRGPGAAAGTVLRIREIVKWESETPAKASINL